MNRDYCLTPREEHYTCMVDLLCRAGRLDEAENFIKKMPFEPNSVVWLSLLSACKIYVNVELGQHAAQRLFELEAENPSTYVILSNIYATVGRWEDVENVREMMKDEHIKKRLQCSWMAVNLKVHTFLEGDNFHPKREANSTRIY